MAYPSTFQNRTRDAAKAELVEYTGGVGQTDALDRAGRAWDSAVREFNSVAWRFNIRVQDIALVDGQQDYDLADKFRSPVRCLMVDNSPSPGPYTRSLVEWFPYAEWLVWRRSQLTGGPLPIRYTARNVHETGKVTFDPRPTAAFTYPTARLIYATWIDLATGGSSVLDVPPDVDEAIFQLAVAQLIAKNKRFGDDAKIAFDRAEEMRMRVERNHRIYGEITQWGANG